VGFEKLLRFGEGKRLKKLQRRVAEVADFEDTIADLSDADLAAMTGEFRQRLGDGETLDDLLPEAFATVREAARRVLGQRPFDVQVLGGVALHEGDIAEMRTGEGKTLTSTMPVYLNALEGKGVHVVTVNPYLAARDAEWMGRVYRFLGLDVGLVYSGQSKAEKRVQYAADITYGTNNELGFDFLRDHMVQQAVQKVQRGHNYVIVDEVDSILIDEARTPLIISGPADQATEWYSVFAKRVVPKLQPEVHYEVDEGKRTVAVTEDGVTRVEQLLGVGNLYESVNTPLIHHLQNAIRAKELFRRDQEYVVADGEVHIVDEFTGRVLKGRRYSEGLHQAIEAKEGVTVKAENQTLATITLQNYFRLYDKLAGMTGTAKTEEGEFAHIYGVGVVEVPTNRPVARADQADLIYKTAGAKFESLADDIAERHERGQPVLVGTVSIEKSEELAKMLARRGIPHEVLNAKNHFKEAEIIAQAGRVGAVTVATNMAGRGVDIMLGGNPEFLADAEARKQLGGGPESEDVDDDEFGRIYEELLGRFTEETGVERQRVLDLGGLYVLGTERHDSRRIDNQLRGRSGRQGDPGESRFYLSLDDDLMRLFNASAVDSIMTRLKLPEDVPIEHKMVSRAVQRAQTQVESRNFEIRKTVLKYDDVMNEQRKLVYAQRNAVLEGDDERVAGVAEQFVEDAIAGLCAQYAPEGVYPEEWGLEDLWTALERIFPVQLDRESLDLETLEADGLRTMLVEDAQARYVERKEDIGADVLRQVERRVILSVVDRIWREHLYEMDQLRDGIGLRAVGQRDPLVEYQREAYEAFNAMMERIKEEAAGYFFNLPVQRAEEQPEGAGADGDGKAPAGVVEEPQGVDPARLTYNAPGGEEQGGQVRGGASYTVGVGKGSPGAAAAAAAKRQTSSTVVNEPKVGRNDPCPCGSGQKYKRCHGAV
jgi:preprotein translocase subunit SecA